MQLMRVALLCFAAVCACTDDPPPAAQQECAGDYYIPYVEPILLSQFPDRPFAIHVGLGSLDTTYEHRQDRYVEIDFEYTDLFFSTHPAPLTDGAKSYCPEFDSTFRASLDGIEATNVYGGWACWGPGGQVCVFPHATVVISPDDHTPEAVLSISDRSRSLSIDLGDSLLERSAAVEGQTDWTFHVNQEAAFTWSPSDDLTTYTAKPAAAFFVPGEVGLSIDGVTQTADALSVTLPDRVTAGSLGLELTRVEDVDAFQLSVSQVVFHDASIVP